VDRKTRLSSWSGKRVRDMVGLVGLQIEDLRWKIVNPVQIFNLKSSIFNQIGISSLTRTSIAAWGTTR
jgi:hypothetical protein